VLSVYTRSTRARDAYNAEMGPHTSPPLKCRKLTRPRDRSRGSRVAPVLDSYLDFLRNR
jgi:hypothetical protein